MDCRVHFKLTLYFKQRAHSGHRPRLKKIDFSQQLLTKYKYYVLEI